MVHDTTCVYVFEKAITTSVKDLPLNVKNVFLSKTHMRGNITTIRVFSKLSDRFLFVID